MSRNWPVYTDPTLRRAKMVAGWGSVAQMYWILRTQLTVEQLDEMLPAMERVAGNASLRETVARLGGYHQDHRHEGLGPECLRDPVDPAKVVGYVAGQPIKREW